MYYYYVRTRRDLSDCFVGASFAMELSTPFLAARAIARLRRKQRGGGGGDGVALAAVSAAAAFFLVRICVFPYVYWLHSAQTWVTSQLDAKNKKKKRGTIETHFPTGLSNLRA